MLNRRQRRLYKNLIDIWQTSRTVSNAGKPSAEAYTLVAAAVPCTYQFTPNIDSQSVAGRLKEFTLLVLDKIYMEASTPIDDMYLVVNVTLLADGSKSHAWGQLHRVEGQPTIYDTLGNRHANCLYVEAMSLEHPMEPIKTHYGL